ncbi:MAG: 2Fe-2S iron-sulfur cluster-binding protein [Tissierellia bacterium]|nr:2Fe-2S iron-sulfur cluster-binding protein [Tissierellia bacterium]
MRRNDIRQCRTNGGIDIFQLQIEDREERIPCAEDQSILDALRKSGVHEIVYGCLGGGCGVCKIEIQKGELRREKVSREHLSEEDAKKGMALACKSYPTTDLVLRIIKK